MKIYFISTMITFLSLFFILNCAGTREEYEDPAYTEKDNSDQDLEDIEALLGITTDESAKQTKRQTQSGQKKDNEGEQLDLLSTEDNLRNQRQTSPTPDEEREYQQKINNLEKQLNRKEQHISELQSTVKRQDSEIQRLSSATAGETRSVSPFRDAGADVTMSEYQAQYDRGRAAFESRKYEEAIRVFQSMLAASSTHKLSDNAQYWIGECHYALRQYDAAIIDFEKVFTFVNSNKKDDAQFKLGLCYLRKGDKTKAREEFERLQADYPDSEFLPKANELMATL